MGPRKIVFGIKNFASRQPTLPWPNTALRWKRLRWSPAILEGVEKLRRLGFNPVLLGSTKYTIQRMREEPDLIKEVRTVFKHVSKAGGVYRKRIASTGHAYMKHNVFCDCVNRADVEKLARMIKILSFLIQTKAYLFWANPACS